MTHRDPTPQYFPRGPLLGAAALMGFALVSVAASRATGVGETRLPPSPTVESRNLHFEDRDDGAVMVLAADGERRVVAVVPAGTNGFLRGVLRGLARDRRLEGIGTEPPFRLSRHSDGRLSLTDAATGRDIELDAFGPTNVQAFSKLLTQWSETR
jgi:putative photosynthetic complex assembly protein